MGDSGYGTCPDGSSQKGCWKGEKVGCGTYTVDSGKIINFYPCFCKKQGYTLQEKKDQAYISNFKQAPKGCTAIHKYLFYNNGSVSIYDILFMKYHTTINLTPHSFILGCG